MLFISNFLTSSSFAFSGVLVFGFCFFADFFFFFFPLRERSFSVQVISFHLYSNFSAESSRPTALCLPAITSLNFFSADLWFFASTVA